MFDVPMMPEIQFAQQSLKHGELRSESQRSTVPILAFKPPQ
jgi:hypothetical protein